MLIYNLLSFIHSKTSSEPGLDIMDRKFICLVGEIFWKWRKVSVGKHETECIMILPLTVTIRQSCDSHGTIMERLQLFMDGDHHKMVKTQNFIIYLS